MTEDVFLVADDNILDTEKRKKNGKDTEKAEQGVDEDSGVLGEQSRAKYFH